VWSVKKLSYKDFILPVSCHSKYPLL
jgi:hypothetical protein